MPSLRENLRQLSEAIGVSGEEREVRQLLLNLTKEHLENVVIDTMGNLTARLKSSQAGALRVMLGAPMDEVGLMVAGSENFLNVLPVGRLDMRYVAAARVVIGAQKLNGVVLFAPIHKTYAQDKLPEPSAIQIDTGGKNSAKVGERIAFVGNYAELNEDIARGKAFQSRAACAVLVALIESLAAAALPLDIYIAFTAQSRIYGRGATVAANRLKPQVAFLLDGTECDDGPRPEDDTQIPRVRLGGGVVLRAMERTGIPDQRLLAFVRSTAEAHRLPYQIDTSETYGTEAVNVSQTQAGVPTAALSVPVRYLYSPNGLVSLSDLETTQRLLREVLAALTPEILEN
ncbi:MAG: hypothetical protein CUN49_14610 [Candidatus Thermofonsia Clade 1 bacterium]|jgi:endoglucanase|uniref:Peptidase M42 n=1 Tax=Candidatus Thermofonsia Clade 1 bacterium TaxID=2364210 RepID=A0A2M8PAT0_9CHLR|nr:MAG: hypothetical protein CUN49_14610 [Candidatus Thermofonsia Clade 1 bacterium]RMF49185.1 MAG: hypothetical protein D6749_13860 [Chloroflexota bacterium]